MMNFGWSGGGWGWEAWGAMTLTMLLLPGAIVAGIATILRSRGERHSPPPATAGPRQDSVLRILDEPFARGEIDAGDYIKRRDLLQSE